MGPNPSGRTNVTFMSINKPESDSANLLRQAMNEGTPALKQFIDRHYRGSGWRVDELLDKMMPADDLYASEVQSVRPPILHKGRFVLVGDAGYGPGFTGSGTSLALSGAYILAGELSKHPGDIKAGLEAYQARMKPIIEDLQKEPPFITAFMSPQTATGIAIRNKVFSSMAAGSGIAGYFQRTFASAFAKNDKHVIEDYKWVE